MSMMNDHEEDLDDFPAENSEKPAESLVVAYRAESTDQFQRFHLFLMDRRPGSSTRT